MSITDLEMLEVWKACKRDPIFHVREVQGVEVIEEFQKELMRAVWKNERVAVRSAHCLGKTWTLARLVLAVATTFPRSKIVTTAPTSRQVELLLWGEIRTGHAASKYALGGKLLTLKWEFAPDWWAIGFTTQKQAAKGDGQANSSFQGVHGEGLVFVIFDEATGIAPDVWKQLEGLLTSANVKFVALGNPTTKNTPFYGCFSDPSYKKIHFSCFDSPNLIANRLTSLSTLEKEAKRLNALNDDEKLCALDAYKVTRPYLLTAKWVMSRTLKWGFDHPLFQSKVLGNFPDEDENALFSLRDVERAQEREPEKKSSSISIGVDVARFGVDQTVITTARGVNVEIPLKLVKRDTTEVTGTVIRHVNTLPKDTKIVIVVDETGIGSGVVDQLKEYRRAHKSVWKHVTIIGLHFGETFSNEKDGSEEEAEDLKEKYLNRKAQIFLELSEDLKDFLVLPNESIYQEELPTITYRFDSKGRYVIEEKEAYKKRTGRASPDYADSLALCNFGRRHAAGKLLFLQKMNRL